MHSPLGADRDGAVVDDGVLAHLGEPLIEQRRLASGRALTPRDDRRVIALSGPERLRWLDSISSQAVATLVPGESTELLILDPQGRVEHAAGVIEGDGTTWLLVDAGDAAGLLRWLTMMRFRAEVVIEERPDVRVLGYMPDGEIAADVTAVALAVWRDPWNAVAPGGWQYAAANEHPGADWNWAEAIVPEQAAVDLAATVALAGSLAFDALRIAHWRPRWASEVDGRLLPHEVDWLRSAVHLAKGCYRGQETVAKVHNLGHPPRRLALLHLDGSEALLPVRGAAVLHSGEPIGEVTAVARHHELGPIALAILSRRTPGDAAVSVEVEGGALAATQEVIVPTDAGATASVPRISRLSRRPLAQPPTGE